MAELNRILTRQILGVMIRRHLHKIRPSGFSLTTRQSWTQSRNYSESASTVASDRTTRVNESEERHNMFVPKCKPPSSADIEELQTFVRLSKKLLVLTGAGLSTESGIPDYRSEGVGLYATSTNRPVQYIDFVKNADIRQRYWARNYVGWPRFGFFLPNISHKTLATWEKLGKIHWLVTQNVDALHYKAGSQKVTELHGSAHRVMCLDCPAKMTRPQMQELIRTTNPNWSAQSDKMAPDADVHLTTEQVQGFKVPACPNCGGRLKPEITFFGDNVPKPVVEFIHERVRESDSILLAGTSLQTEFNSYAPVLKDWGTLFYSCLSVFGDNVPKPVVEFIHERVRESDSILLAGTSLQVYSGYRFVNAAKEQKKPIAILNIGPTRADKLADLTVNTKCGDVLPKIKITR